MGRREYEEKDELEVTNREADRKEKMDEFAMQKAKQDFLLKTQDFNLRKQISENNKAIAIINPS